MGRFAIIIGILFFEMIPVNLISHYVFRVLVVELICGSFLPSLSPKFRVLLFKVVAFLPRLPSNFLYFFTVLLVIVLDKGFLLILDFHDRIHSLFVIFVYSF